jgi:integrase
MEEKTYPEYFIFQVLTPKHQSFFFKCISLDKAKKKLEMMDFAKEDRFMEELKKYSYRDMEIHQLMKMTNLSASTHTKELNHQIDRFIQEKGIEKLLNDRKNYQSTSRTKKASVHVRLTKPNNKGLSNVYFDYNYTSPKFSYYPIQKISVNPDFFDAEREDFDIQKVKKSDSTLAFSYQNINNKLSVIANYIEECCDDYIENHNIKPEKNILKDLVDKKYMKVFGNFIAAKKGVKKIEKKEEEPPKNSILEEIRNYIEENPRLITKGTLYNYKKMEMTVKGFFKDNPQYSSLVEKFNKKTWDALKSYMVKINDKKGRNNKTLNSQLQLLISILNYSDTKVNTKKFDKFKELKAHIEFISEEEIKRLYDYIPPSVDMCLFEKYQRGKVTFQEVYTLFHLPTKEERIKFFEEKGIKPSYFSIHQSKYNLYDKIIENPNIEPVKTYQHIKDILLFLFYTGLRWSDYLAFKKSNIIDKKMEDGTIRKILTLIQKKTRSNVNIPLNSVALEILEKYNYRPPVATNKFYNTFIKSFFKWFGGFDNKVTVKQLYGTEVVYEEYYRYELIKIHSTRHSIASALIEKNDVYTVQTFLGHASPRTTEIYLHKKEDETINKLFNNLNDMSK